MSFKQLQEAAKKQDPKDQLPIIHTSSLIDGEKVIEMIYDPDKGKSHYLVWDGETPKEVPEYEMGGIIYRPFSPSKNIIRKGIVKFPSALGSYSSTSELIHEVQTFMRKYMTVSKAFEPIVIYYVLFSWVHDAFSEVPYLRAIGDYGNGKSRFLKVVGNICYKPIFVGGAGSIASIFRLLNEYKGTLVIDEADAKGTDTFLELVKIYNSGFQKGVPVPRAIGNKNNDFDIEGFEVFGPKIMGARFHFTDEALESRILTEDMALVTMNPEVPINIPPEFDAEAQTLRNKLLMYRFRNLGTTQINSELFDPRIEPRLNQIAVPLMSIVEDENSLKALQSYIQKHNETVQGDRTHSLVYEVAESVCALIGEGFVEPTIMKVAERFNQYAGHGDSVSAKRMGHYVRKYLGLQTHRTPLGYVVSKTNHELILSIAKKYGFDDMNFMNIMQGKRTKKPLNQGVL